MSTEKLTVGLKYDETIPKMMKFLGIKTQLKLAEHLEFAPTNLTNYKHPDKGKEHIPLEWALKFLIKNKLPLEFFWPSDSDAGGGVPYVPGERKEPDLEYTEAPALWDEGPEFAQGKQILKLYLLNSFFNECNLENLRFKVLTEGNFYPLIPPGSILVMDTTDKRITASYYVFGYGNHSYALRRIDPLDDEKVLVYMGQDTKHNPSREMSIADVKRLIIGRVVWIVVKV